MHTRMKKIMLANNCRISNNRLGVMIYGSKRYDLAICDSRQMFRKTYNSFKPDILILEKNFGGQPWENLYHSIVSDNKKIIFIGYTISYDADFERQLRALHIRGYLTSRSSRNKQIVKAVSRVL